MFNISTLNKSSFRGVPFYTKKTSSNGGQRLTTHTFINGGTKTVSNGLKQNSFSIEAFIVGDDYLAQRENLKNALNVIGSGILIDKFYGTLDVQVDTYTIEEDRESYGKATFKINFELAENKPVEETQLLVVTDIQDEAITAFKSNFDNTLGESIMDSVVTKIQGFLGGMNKAISFLDNTSDTIQNTKSQIGRTVSNVKSNILSIDSLASDIVDTVGSFDEVFNLELYQSENGSQFVNSIKNQLNDLNIDVDDEVEALINRQAFIYGATMISILNQKSIVSLENIDFVTGDDFGSVKNDTITIFETLQNELSKLTLLDNTVQQQINIQNFMELLATQRSEFIFFYTQKYSGLQSLTNDNIVFTTDLINYTMLKYDDINRLDEVMQNNDLIDPIFVSGTIGVLEKWYKLKQMDLFIVDLKVYL